MKPLALAVVAAAVLAVASAPARAKTAPSISVPPTTAVGADVRVTLRGFPRGTTVEIHLIPTIHRGGNCCGIQAKLLAGRRTNAAGAAAARFRWPEHWLRCGGAHACEKLRWTRNQRVDVLVLVGTVRRIKVIRLTQ